MTELMTPEAEAASARAAEQARLRKARREAKIKAGAENRLNKITGLGGGVPRDPAPAPSTTPAAAAAAAAAHADPDEVDISEHFYQPQTTARIPPPSAGGGTTNPISDAHLRQMMLGLDNPTPPPRTGTPSGAMPAGMPAPPPGMEDDPMMRMMMQMMGGGPGGAGEGAGAGGGGNPFAGMPGMGGMGMPGMPGMSFPGQTAPLPSRSASLWRLLHALIALALGLYIALCTPFSGTKMSRDRAAAAAAGSAEERAFLAGEDGKAAVARDFFWAFATAEAVLLGTRWFVERGRSRLGGAAGGSGILGMAVGFLPAGIRRKVEIAMRYGEVFGTVKGDVLVCVFVLGAAAWVRG